jgi:hypothetical protein
MGRSQREQEEHGQGRGDGFGRANQLSSSSRIRATGAAYVFSEFLVPAPLP